MTKLRVHNLSISLDGYAAGPGQREDAPLGEGGEALHEWLFATRYGHTMMGEEGGSTGLDDELAWAGDVGIGATIMGRNTFGPVRGEWGDSEWRGWWGPTPPYHHAVFVLTHHARPPIEMDGGTTFHFVADGIEAALDLAGAAAGGGDVRLLGGASTVRQYLRAGLVDEMRLAQVPVLLGTGERLIDGPEVADRYRCVEQRTGDGVVHLRFTRA